ALLVPTNRTLTILRELQGDSVTLETMTNNVRIKGERADYKLGLENPDLFPTIQDFREENYHTLDAGTLRQLIRRTIFAVDTERTRYALGGVLVELGAEKATLAATDTRRLSIAVGKCAVHGTPHAEGSPPVVPARAMLLIERSLAEDTSQVQLAIRANDMLMRGGLATIYSRLVEGRFPKYQDVVPRNCKTSLELQVESFLAVVRQAQIVTNEDSRGVDFEFAPGLLTLTSQAPDIGESKVDLPISYDGPAITVSLDPKFVSDFLRTLDQASTIRVELTDSESAVVLKTEDGSIYIVMPLSRDR
ncbi:MAG: DNA polymerase III subunit beta, partial [Planctomycetota bacterium]|nr:DNA polymerase III subunit beta [Planctomycetota bacterium]